MKPAWLISQLRSRGICETCARKRAETEWSGTGQLICWDCLEVKREANR